MADPRERRLAALEARCAELDLAVLLVTRPADLRYLTGFTGTAGVLVARPGRPVFLSDFRYREQAGRELPPGMRAETVTNDLWAGVWKALKDRPPAEVGFDADGVSVARAQAFAEAGLPWSFRPAGGVVAALRERKDAAEVRALRQAADLAAAALDATWPAVRVGATERDIAVQLEAALRRAGSEWHPFPTIVASGPRSAEPHARTSDRALRPGDLVLVDFGAMVDGYCADLTRTVVVGRAPDERQRRAFALVRAAQQAAFDGLSAGMRGADADALARRVIEAAGLGDAFGHALGHGVGLEVHEAPRLARGNRVPLPADAVVTVEPGVYFGGWGGVRLEDTVHLTASGAVLLSHPAAALLTLD